MAKDSQDSHAAIAQDRDGARRSDPARDNDKPAAGAGNPKAAGADEHQATTEEFDREGLGIAPKE